MDEHSTARRAGLQPPSARGAEIGKLFIENGRLHAVAVVKHILAKRGTAPAAPLAAPRICRFQDGDWIPSPVSPISGQVHDTVTKALAR